MLSLTMPDWARTSLIVLAGAFVIGAIFGGCGAAIFGGRQAIEEINSGVLDQPLLEQEGVLEQEGENAAHNLGNNPGRVLSTIRYVGKRVLSGACNEAARCIEGLCAVNMHYFNQLTGITDPSITEFAVERQMERNRFRLVNNIDFFASPYDLYENEELVLEGIRRVRSLREFEIREGELWSVEPREQPLLPLQVRGVGNPIPMHFRMVLPHCRLPEFRGQLISFNRRPHYEIHGHMPSEVVMYNNPPLTPEEIMDHVPSITLTPYQPGEGVRGAGEMSPEGKRTLVGEIIGSYEHIFIEQLQRRENETILRQHQTYFGDLRLVENVSSEPPFFLRRAQITETHYRNGEARPTTNVNGWVLEGLNMAPDIRQSYGSRYHGTASNELIRIPSTDFYVRIPEQLRYREENLSITSREIINNWNNPNLDHLRLFGKYRDLKNARSHFVSNQIGSLQQYQKFLWSELQARCGSGGIANIILQYMHEWHYLMYPVFN